MQKDQVVDRLLELARVRLARRFGAFEQFEFKVRNTVQGVAIIAEALCYHPLLPFAVAMGDDKAVVLIDRHLLSVIDRWAGDAGVVTVDPLPGQQLSPPLERGTVMSRKGLIAAHKSRWPDIETDIKGASENGLASAAKAGARGWLEDAALAWARAKGRLETDDKAVVRIDAAMHRMSNLPSRKHRI